MIYKNMTNDYRHSLKQTFGFDGFRQGQEQTITQLLAGQSSLAIFPTGSGKSLCYQLTSLHLPHLTLVVSPLLALIKDQLAFLANKGVVAASIDSTLKGNEAQQVMTDVRSGKTKILMVSVERFKNERFRQFIQSVPVSMLVVDEAHCISEWGHNFRPDYLKLPSYQQALNIPLVLLLTATATKQVKEDMAQKFAINNNHIVQTGFYRANLDLTVVPVHSSDKNNQLTQLIKQQTGSGIVYVTLQHTAEQVANYLLQQGVNACAYHAGFDSDKRQKIQQDFMSGQVQVIVATIAFGMGIDKADIRFVIHFDLPKSIENYSQEIGRAGRDGQHAFCFTLANLDGLTTVENFVYGDTPEQTGISCIIGKIKAESQLAYGEYRWETQINPLSNESNIRQLPIKTLLVQLELLGIIEPLYAYFADFKLKFLQNKEQVVAGFNPERQAFLKVIFSHIQFKKIWGDLNFDTLLAQPNIDRNRVVAALDYLHEKQLIVLETKQMTEVFNINMDKLSALGLAENLHHYFVEKEQKEINRISALVAFFEQTNCLTYTLSQYFDDQQAPTNCGHCSVCRGEVAKLNYSTEPQWPSDEEIIAVVKGFMNHMSVKVSQPITLDTCCRFLAGISVPIFTRNKVKQLPGFGLCQQLRYAEIKEKLTHFSLGAFY
jgi:ATP-dependent DNA helicase RecQ